MKNSGAEDDAISRMLLQRTLQRAGYEVAAVEDGCRALAELSKEDPRGWRYWIGSCQEWTASKCAAKYAGRKDHAYTYLIFIVLSRNEAGHRARAGVRRGRLP